MVSARRHLQFAALLSPRCMSSAGVHTGLLIQLLHRCSFKIVTSQSKPGQFWLGTCGLILRLTLGNVFLWTKSVMDILE